MQRQKSIYFNSGAQSCYGYIAGVRSVATCLTYFDNFSILAHENKKYLLEIKESLLITQLAHNVQRMSPNRPVLVQTSGPQYDQNRTYHVFNLLWQCDV